MAPLRLLTAFSSIFLTAATAEFGAMPGPGLSPRYYLGESAHLVNRQNADCPQPNQHTCLDINAAIFCCANTHYCIVANDIPSCCFIGSTCGNLCDANHYECAVTTTVSSTATVTTSCCPRSCTTTSQYLCPSSYGGQCCNFSEKCAANKQCVATATSSNSVVITGTGGSSSTVPTGTGTSSSSSSGLSTGAKAGIGAGVAVGALVVLSGFIWFCLAQRRRAKQRAASVPAMSQGSESGGKKPSNGRQGSDYFGPTAAVGPFTEHHDSVTTSPGTRGGVPVSPQGPGDITVPVEIDSKSSRGHSNVTTPGAFEYVKPPDTAVNPVELP